MKLSYYKEEVPNFGDELNPWLWDRLLPAGFLDDDPSELFIGIGSILWNTWPRTSLKHVIGSGYGGYTAAPDLHDGSWNVVFVRGPRTAERLGLPARTAICDSAILLRMTDLPEPAAGLDIGFMPHFESLQRGFWAEACRLAGIRLIDPRGNVETVLSEVRGCRMLVTEAMHGAIVADAVRTPWVGVRPLHSSHHTKWLDWSEALGIDLRMHDLRPSSLLEVDMTLVRPGKMHGPNGNRLNKSLLAAPFNKALTYMAAQRLRQIARQEPQLSSDANIERATERAHAALERFVSARKA